MSNDSRIDVEKNIWKEVERLCGTELWDLKQYVLGILFYRFISEHLTNYINLNQDQAGIRNFNYLEYPDAKAEKAKSTTIEEIGYFIKPSQLFGNLLLSGKENDNLNEDLSLIFTSIEESSLGSESEINFKGLFNELDVNSLKLGDTVKARNKKLYEFISSIASWNLGSLKSKDSNFYGDTFEFLITNFASKAGKTGGNFFTPTDVSELLVNLTLASGNKVSKVYDPACGSGSLLLKYQKACDGNPEKIQYFGQDENLPFYNFCRINMFLHQVQFENFSIFHGDTLLDPQHLEDGPFDAIVSNPRFSKAWEGESNSLLINNPRFSPAGVLAPKSKHDMAFIMHCLYSLSNHGTAALAEHPGVMYRDRAELKIRKYLIDNNYIDAVIQIPPKLFFGVDIAPYVLVFKKNRSTTDVIFIDAKLEFKKIGKRNRLLSHHILKIFEAYKQNQEIESFSKIIAQEEIKLKNYSLTIENYISDGMEYESIDIVQLNTQIKSSVSCQNEARNKIEELITDIEVRKNE